MMVYGMAGVMMGFSDAFLGTFSFFGDKIMIRG